MDIKEIKKILGLETLDESQQEAIEEKINMMVEMKAQEKVDDILKEEKEKLVEEYETKFEEYKKDITSKFSNFVDSVLDEELEIPEKILEFAHRGEMYHDLVEDFKKRLAIDAGVLSEDVKELLREAKEELESQKVKMNELISENMEIKEDAKVMAAKLYIQKKCEGLTESKRLKVVALIGESVDQKEIDKKYDFVLEHVLGEEDSGNTAGGEGTDPEAATNVVMCPDCGIAMTAQGENGVTCPKCGKKAEDLVASIEPAGDGTGNAVVDPETKVTEEVKVVNETVEPWEEKQKAWLKILKEHRI